MSAAKVSDRLLMRLKYEEIIPVEVKSDIRSTYASENQRAAGAWSWCASWYDGQRTVGSQYTMTECLRAPAWEIDRHRLGSFGEITVDPKPLPQRRAR